MRNFNLLLILSTASVHIIVLYGYAEIRFEGISRSRLYALCPLSVLRFYSSGHNKTICSSAVVKLSKSSLRLTTTHDMLQ